ncbi:hypothetical protein [Burkholderia ubonensis]|uniref:hypothetical protein n=1 Tax=Burkholderia ubonensis TaxID=101571 RepID=UPI000AD4AE47|nr:hypothetical protein [Burkholderia ubonensis]
MAKKSLIDETAFNRDAVLPYTLRIDDFKHAMLDVYDFFSDVNSLLSGKGLQRLDDMMRPAAMSGLISDMVTATLARSSRSLVENKYFNGHPDLVVRGKYPNDEVKAGVEGVEIKTTRKPGGAVDTHGARDQWMCVFVYAVDTDTEPAVNRAPMRFTEVYLAHVEEADFRKNPRGELGTKTATLHEEGVAKLRKYWIYLEANGDAARAAKAASDAAKAAEKAAKTAAKAAERAAAKAAAKAAKVAERAATNSVKIN